MLIPRLIFLALLAALSSQAAQKTLDVYFIDVEGGQATLFVTPAGQSLLVDTGWPGARDADRIAAAAHKAGITKLDYVLITHFHLDHVGGVPELVKRLPVGTFIDHGTSVEHDRDADGLYNSYVNARGQTRHIEAKPGDHVPLKGVDWQLVSAAGDLIAKPLPGAGQKNPLCGSDPRRDADATENARSVGSVITFGKFRAVDLGDLTWNKEQDLVCPVNLLGKADVYIVSHHGMNMSGSATFVHALHPRAAIMDNGARKGGTPEAYQAIKSSPGIADIWQVHRAVGAGDANNTTEQLTANVAESPDEGFGIQLSARRDGSFTVTNLRNGFAKEYRAAR